MHRPLAILALLTFAYGPIEAQQAPPRGQSAPSAIPYFVGNPLGMPITPGADGAFAPISPNVKVFGAVYSAESCAYDAERGVIVVPNRGVPPSVRGNDAWITLLNHDGSVHTSRWIGVQFPAQRDSLSPRLMLNEPFGSDIMGGVLYLADRDGGTSPADTAVSVIRRFDLRNGFPRGDIRLARGIPWFNDIAVTANGTIYASATGANQVWRILPGGEASVFLGAAPLNRPNGVAMDEQGNIVVVNFGDDAVLTFAPDGTLRQTERAAQAGSDGIVVMPDGTKYVSSVSLGGISRIRPGEAAELIAENIPNGASMCLDTGANQLVVPMNANNGMAFVPLGGR